MVLMVTFPLYWLKVMDWRLCEVPSEALANDPWLMAAPSPEYAAGWPCNSGLGSKLRYALSSPSPFLRSLVWPICYSELHFLTSFYTAIVGGLVMWLLVPSEKYLIDNPARVAWQVTSRVQVKAVTVLVKVLRPNTPWPRTVSQTLHTQALASSIFSLALAIPVRFQALGAAIEVVQVAAICLLHGDDWPYELPPAVLIRMHVVYGVAAVCLSAVMLNGFRGVGGMLRTFASFLGRRGTAGGKAGKAHQLASDDEPASAAAGHSNADASPSAEQQVQKDEVEVAKVGSGAESVLPSLAPGGEPPQFGLCCRLIRAHRGAAAAAAAGPPISGAGDRPGGDAQAPGERPEISAAADSSGAGTSTSSGASGPAVDALDSESLAAYAGALAHTHLCLKLPDVEPEDLPPGAEARLAEAIGLLHPGVVTADVALRAGCVEVHLDLVRQAPPVGPVGAHAEPEPGAPAGAQFAPAPAEQQGLASCILQALGLPPGYDSTVKAQIGAHLLTLTPAAPTGSSAGAWAVLGTRRMQALEVPWVSRVEPPAIVTEPCGGREEGAGGPACACACRVLLPDSVTGSGDDAGVPGVGSAAVGDGPSPQPPDPLRHFASVRMAVSGSAERLAAAHADQDLEVLALFEGEFLPVTELQWGPLENPFTQGGGAGGAGAGGVRLPPSLSICQRVVSATLCLPRGRSGAVNLVLMRRGTAGQSHALLLLQPGEEAIAAEVKQLKARAHLAAGLGGELAGAVGPPVSSVDRFVADMGRWLQYRDFWREQAAVAAAAAAGGAAGATVAEGAAGGGLGRSRRESHAWKDALMARFWRYSRGPAPGERKEQSKQGSLHGSQRDQAPQQGVVLGREPASSGLAIGAGAPFALTNSKPQALSSPDLHQQSDTDRHRRTHANGSLAAAINQAAAEGPAGPPASANHGPQAHPHQHQDQHPHPHAHQWHLQSAEEHQRLVQRSMPAFRQAAYQNHMRSARRTLLEFALEQRCVAVAASLLEYTPLPPATPMPSPAAALALAPRMPGLAGMAGAHPDASATMAPAAAAPPAAGVVTSPGAYYTFLADLAESSRAASADGLSLLHRAVRSGDPHVVDLVIRAGEAATAAAAAAVAQGAQAPDHASLQDPQDGNGFPPAASQVSAAAPGGTQEPAAGPGSGPACPAVFAWDTPDAHGLTPLHYVAVLDDGGAMARHVLRAHADALALWDAGPPQMPSAASFAAQNSWRVDVEALRRECEEEQQQRRRQQQHQRDQQQEQEQADGKAETSRRRHPVLASLLGFPSGDMESSYQRSAVARGGGLPVWLLLMHLTAFVAGLAQARCQPAVFPLVLLHAVSFLLGLCCAQHPGLASGRAYRGAAWALQAFALAALAVRSQPWLADTNPTPGADAADAARQGTCYGGEGHGAGTGCGYGGTALQSGLLALYHALAVATVPLSHTLSKVLVVQAVEAAALFGLGYAALGYGAGGGGGGMGRCRVDGGDIPGGALESGGTDDDDAALAGALGFAVAGAAAMVQVARGSLLRGVASSLLVLVADLRTRVLFLRHHHEHAKAD